MNTHLNILVLILIVLEFALAHIWKKEVLDEYKGLNPYCTGICSRTYDDENLRICKISLNPYCTGICSRTTLTFVLTTILGQVLILIVLEFALAP